MEPEVLAALEQSILHWEENVQHLKNGEPNLASADASDCALCEHFNSDCDDCPVSQKTERASCFGSPYYSARTAIYGSRLVLPEKTVNPDNVAAVQEEVDFLKSLLPGSHTATE